MISQNIIIHKKSINIKNYDIYYIWILIISNTIDSYIIIDYIFLLYEYLTDILKNSLGDFWMI